jgi:hypothetical protein
MQSNKDNQAGFQKRSGSSKNKASGHIETEKRRGWQIQFEANE